MIPKSELNLNAMVLDVNIPRDPNYGYHYVIGHAVDSSGNLFAYFDGSINASDVIVMIHYRRV